MWNDNEGTKNDYANKAWSNDVFENIANFWEKVRLVKNCTQNNLQKIIIKEGYYFMHDKVFMTKWFTASGDATEMMAILLFVLPLMVSLHWQSPCLKRWEFFCLTLYLITFQLFMPDERCNRECQIPSRLLDMGIETLFISDI